MIIGILVFYYIVFHIYLQNRICILVGQQEWVLRAVAPSSIDKSQVNVEKGEMSFQRIKFQNEMDDIINTFTGSTDAHKALDQLVNRFW